MENIFLERFHYLLDEKFDGNKAKLAKSTGISAPTLSQYYPPRSSSPSAKQLVALAEAFDCTTDYLLGREDDFGNIVVSSGAPAELSEQEKELLKNFNKLSIFERDSILVQVEALAQKQLIKK